MVHELIDMAIKFDSNLVQMSNDWIDICEGQDLTQSLSEGDPDQCYEIGTPNHVETDHILTWDD